MNGSELSSTNWMQVLNSEILGQGGHANTFVSFNPIRIPQGSQQALYVSSTASMCSDNGVSVNGTSLNLEEVAYNTTDFDLNVGVDVTYLFQNLDWGGYPKIFNGVVYYRLTS